MFFQGKIAKEGKLWVISVPCFEITTQGNTRKEAFSMLQEVIEGHIDQKGFKTQIHFRGPSDFLISSNQEVLMIALLLKRQRQINGLSLYDMQRLLSYKSVNAYAQYERGRTAPGTQKLEQFLGAMNPDYQVGLTLCWAPK